MKSLSRGQGHLCLTCWRYWGVARCLQDLTACSGTELPCPVCIPDANSHIIGQQKWAYVGEDEFDMWVRETREKEAGIQD